MDVKELKSIMAEYGKVKHTKVIQYQNRGTENRAMISYEKEMGAQRAITKINRYEGWKTKNYIKNKTTRSRNQLMERTNTSSRKAEI